MATASDPTIASSAPAGAAPTRYLEPDWFTRTLFNPLVRRLTRLGLSIRGSRELRVIGRRSGKVQSIPVNPIEVDGVRYLVAPRGTTQWVRNLRAAGTGELRLGRKVEAFSATELDDADKPAVLRPYIKIWKMEVASFFEGVDHTASDEQLAAIGPNHPVFRIDAVGR